MSIKKHRGDFKTLEDLREQLPDQRDVILGNLEKMKGIIETILKDIKERKLENKISELLEDITHEKDELKELIKDSRAADDNELQELQIEIDDFIDVVNGLKGEYDEFVTKANFALADKVVPETPPRPVESKAGPKSKPREFGRPAKKKEDVKRTVVDTTVKPAVETGTEKVLRKFPTTEGEIDAYLNSIIEQAKKSGVDSKSDEVLKYIKNDFAGMDDEFKVRLGKWFNDAMEKFISYSFGSEEKFKAAIEKFLKKFLEKPADTEKVSLKDVAYKESFDGRFTYLKHKIKKEKDPNDVKDWLKYAIEQSGEFFDWLGENGVDSLFEKIEGLSVDMSDDKWHSALYKEFKNLVSPLYNSYLKKEEPKHAVLEVESSEQELEPVLTEPVAPSSEPDKAKGEDMKKDVFPKRVINRPPGVPLSLVEQPVAPEQEKIKIIDIPEVRLTELLLRHRLPQVREAARIMYNDLIHSGRRQILKEEVVSVEARKAFMEIFDSNTPDSQIMEELQRYGITDWAQFKELWDGDLAEKTAKVMSVHAQESMRKKIAQNIGRMDIFKKFKWQMTTRIATMVAVVGGASFAAILSGGGALAAGAVGGGVRGWLNKKIFGSEKAKAKQDKMMAELLEQKGQEIIDKLLSEQFGEGEQGDVEVSLENLEGLPSFSAIVAQSLREITTEAHKQEVFGEDHPEEAKNLVANERLVYERALREMTDLNPDQEYKRKLAVAISAIRGRSEGLQALAEQNTDPRVIGALQSFFKAHRGEKGIGASMVTGAVVAGAFAESHWVTRATLGGAAGAVQGYKEGEARFQKKEALVAKEALMSSFDRVRNFTMRMLGGDELDNEQREEFKNELLSLMRLFNGNTSKDKLAVFTVMTLNHQTKQMEPSFDATLYKQLESIIYDAQRTEILNEGEDDARLKLDKLLEQMTETAVAINERQAEDDKKDSKRKWVKGGYKVVGALAGATLGALTAVAVGEAVKRGRESIMAGIMAEEPKDLDTSKMIDDTTLSGDRLYGDNIKVVPVEAPLHDTGIGGGGHTPDTTAPGGAIEVESVVEEIHEIKLSPEEFKAQFADSLVHKGEGITHVLQRDLHANPDHIDAYKHISGVAKIIDAHNGNFDEISGKELNRAAWLIENDKVKGFGQEVLIKGPDDNVVVIFDEQNHRYEMSTLDNSDIGSRIYSKLDVSVETTPTVIENVGGAGTEVAVPQAPEELGGNEIKNFYPTDKGFNVIMPDGTTYEGYQWSAVNPRGGEIGNIDSLMNGDAVLVAGENAGYVGGGPDTTGAGDSTLDVVGGFETTQKSINVPFAGKLPEGSVIGTDELLKMYGDKQGIDASLAETAPPHFEGEMDKTPPVWTETTETAVTPEVQAKYMGVFQNVRDNYIDYLDSKVEYIGLDGSAEGATKSANLGSLIALDLESSALLDSTNTELVDMFSPDSTVSSDQLSEAVSNNMFEHITPAYANEAQLLLNTSVAGEFETDVIEGGSNILKHSLGGKDYVLFDEKYNFHRGNQGDLVATNIESGRDYRVDIDMNKTPPIVSLK